MPSLSTRATEGFSYLQTLPRKGLDWYNGLSREWKIMIWVSNALHVLLMLIMWWIGPDVIFAKMAEWAQDLRDMDYGWALILSLIVLTSFPPMMGYGTCISLCGFAFGPLRGWLLGSAGCLLGGMLSFLFCRRLVHLFAPWLAKAKTFRALSSVVRAKGLPLVVLIRFCPFPFPYSNSFFAAVETVSLWAFMLATLAITPKLGIHVWVGSKAFLLADPESRNKMDTATKWLNTGYIVFGTVVGIATSWYLYKLTMKYVEELAAEEGHDLETGLMDDVDHMLDEDDSDNNRAASPASSDGEADRHNTNTSSGGAIALGRTKFPPSSSHDQRDSVDTTRQSEDNWEGSMSDFGDLEERQEADLLGLGGGQGLETIEERPTPARTKSRLD